MQNPFMARAIQLSIENVRSGRGGPFGAIIVKEGDVIAEGVNCVTQLNDPTSHAVVIVLRQACRILKMFELKGFEIYTSFEPCALCLGAIDWAGPSRLFFVVTSAF